MPGTRWRYSVYTHTHTHTHTHTGVEVWEGMDAGKTLAVLESLSVSPICLEVQGSGFRVWGLVCRI